MLLKIGDNGSGPGWRLLAPNDVELRHLIRVQKATGIGSEGLATQLKTMWEGMAEAQRLQQEAQTRELTAEEQVTARYDPDLLTLGMLVWISRLQAGEDITIEQACSFSLSQMRIELEPHEERAAKEAEERAAKEAAAREQQVTELVPTKGGAPARKSRAASQ